MGYDLLTWVPRKGASGDDQYDVADNTLIQAGDASGFSATPTLGELGASWGLNQVIGLLNRRILQFNSLVFAGQTTLAAESYVTTGSVGSATKWVAVKNKIDALRTQEGLAAYAWPAMWTPLPSATYEVMSGKLIRGAHLLHLRKALRIAGVWSKAHSSSSPTTPGCKAASCRIGHVLSSMYPAAGALGWYGYYGCGKRRPSPTPPFYTDRLRSLIAFPVPHWFAQDYVASHSLMCSVTYRTAVNWIDVVYSGQCFASATDDAPQYNGDATVGDNLDADEGTFPSAVGVKTLYPSLDRIEAKAGAHICYLFGEDLEMAGTGGTGDATHTESVMGWGSTPRHTLTCDFGT